MKAFATLPEAERRETFLLASKEVDLPPAIVEKDFWVCWLLGHIFAAPSLGDHCVFKGGTSLSKVFGAIDRFARHYSDFASLWRHPGGQRAAERFDLLERVRLHKSRYFASSWAHYELAVPGTMRLLPPESRIAELRRDYAAMRPMFLGEPLSFEEMLAVLREAEQTLNRP
jgi:hypothetical protein